MFLVFLLIAMLALPAAALGATGCTYPASLDTFADESDLNDVTVAKWNTQNCAAEKAQAELGTDPAGTFGTVKLRLDDLDNAKIPPYSLATLPAAGTPDRLGKLTDGPVAGAIIYDDGTDWRCISEIMLGITNPLCPPYNAKGDTQTYSDGVINGTTTFTSAARACVAADVGKTLNIADAMNGDTDLSDAVPTYQWTASGSGTSEYYLEANGGGEPSGAAAIPTQPDTVVESGTERTEGTAGSLTAGQWDFADNDTLGYGTIYYRTTGSVDPDTLAAAVLYSRSYDGHSTTVASCSGSSFILAAAPARTATGLKWRIGSLDSVAVQAAMDSVETTKRVLRFSRGVAGLGSYLLEAAVNYSASAPLKIECDPGVKLIRELNCTSSGASTCSTGGSAGMVNMTATGEEVIVDTCEADGSNDMLGPDNGERIDLFTVGLATKKARFRNTITRRSPAYGYRVFSNTPTPVELVELDKVKAFENWEGGFQICCGNQIGSVATPAEITIRDYECDSPSPHPNDATFGAWQGPNCGIAEQAGTPGSGRINKLTIDNYIANASTTAFQSTNPTQLDVRAQVGDLCIRDTSITGLYTKPSDEHSSRQVVIGHCTTDATDVDKSDVYLADIGVLGNNGVQSGVGIVEVVNSFTAKPTNLSTHLDMSAVNVGVSLGSQADNGVKIDGYFNSADLSAFDIVRATGVDASTNFECGVLFTQDVGRLSYRGIKVSTDNDLGHQPVCLTAGKTYGLVPGQKLRISRTAPDNGDIVQIGKFDRRGNYGVNIARVSSKRYDFGASIVGSTSYALVSPITEVLEAGYNWNLEMAENVSNEMDLRIHQIGGATAGTWPDYTIMVDIPNVSAQQGTKSQIVTFTPSTTDGGPSTPVSLAHLESKAPVNWTYVVPYTRFTGAGATANVLVAQIPVNRTQVKNLTADVTIAFVCGAGGCDRTNADLTVGDSDDADGYVLAANAIGSTGFYGNATAEVGVYNPDNAAPDANVSSGGYWPDKNDGSGLNEIRIYLTLSGGTTGVVDNLTAGEVVIRAELYPN